MKRAKPQQQQSYVASVGLWVNIVRTFPEYLRDIPKVAEKANLVPPAAVPSIIRFGCAITDFYSANVVNLMREQHDMTHE